MAIKSTENTCSWFSSFISTCLGLDPTPVEVKGSISFAFSEKMERVFQSPLGKQRALLQQKLKMVFPQAAEMLKQLHVRRLKVVWQNSYYLPTARCTCREATVKWEVLILPKHTAPSIILCIKWSSSPLSTCTRAVRRSSLVASMSRNWWGTLEEK